MLGGLIRHSNNENINKVPILGSAPIIGPLFQQKTSGQEKRNLMVFIKPIIVHAATEGLMITQVKYDNTRQTQANFRNELADIGNAPVETKLPPWKNKRDLPTPFATVER